MKEVSEKVNAAVIAREEERNEVQEINKEYRATIDKLRTKVKFVCGCLIICIIHCLVVFL